VLLTKKRAVASKPRLMCVVNWSESIKHLESGTYLVATLNNESQMLFGLKVSQPIYRFGESKPRLRQCLDLENGV